MTEQQKNALIGRRVRALGFAVSKTGPGLTTDPETGLVRDEAGEVVTVDDNVTVPAGTEGTVTFVDYGGAMSVDWDNRRRINLLPGQDSWEFV